jgi:hypothetical protein
MRTLYLTIFVLCLLTGITGYAQQLNSLEQNGSVNTYRLYSDPRGTTVKEFTIEYKNGRYLFSSDQFSSELVRKRNGHDYYFVDDSREYSKLRFDYSGRVRLYTKGTMTDVFYRRGYYRCTNHWPYHTSPSTNGFPSDCFIEWRWK